MYLLNENNFSLGFPRDRSNPEDNVILGGPDILPSDNEAISHNTFDKISTFRPYRNMRSVRFTDDHRESEVCDLSSAFDAKLEG